MNAEGCTLFKAIAEDRLDILKSLLEEGADPNVTDADGMTPLMLAAAEGRADAVNMLILSGSDVNEENHAGCTALMLAAYQGHSEIVKTLLKQGAKSTSKMKDAGLTAFMLAALGEHLDVVELLQCEDGMVEDGTKAYASGSRGRHQEYGIRVAELLREMDK